MVKFLILLVLLVVAFVLLKIAFGMLKGFLKAGLSCLTLILLAVGVYFVFRLLH